MRQRLKLAAAALTAAAASAGAQAWLLEVTPGPRTLYLQVGNGTEDANNSTINRVSGSVGGAQVGNGTPLALTSNSTFANSFYDGYAVCNPPNEVYVGGYFRFPSSSTSTVARLQVTHPTNLTSGSDTLPFSSISWVSSANGDSTPHIPSGSFSGGTQTLRTLNANTWVENCLTFQYANTLTRPSGTYSGQVTYTLTMP